MISLVQRLSLVWLLLVVAVPTVCAQGEYASSTIDVGVVVSDLDRAMTFYRDVMGMTKVNRYDLDSEFARQSGLTGGIPLQIEVLTIEDAPEATEFKLMSFGKEAQHPKQKWIQDDTGVQYVTLSVESLTPFLERFDEAGVELLGNTPTPINDEVSLVLVQDPDGTFIELIGPR